ncbi:hypothetical protein LEP1GSC185_0539 [Leptospira licerasiae serovar Varillal str. VAR 010]|uniref:Uncharacterized protein n=1 Tax=Leptospira licerasiae str. MMD4847 TaxID=1049971 RepID=A0ABP2RAF1_9LEPT|nr:hypothetical protein LEP1GSC185_0539 [Leptospira licerasiae serovar Varillal str. VAR 010]EJZ41517.1 hypothetical protein LEP1GSC178_4002 [Leptospira licerasiae str. MMD4847]
MRFSLTGQLSSLHWFLRPFPYGESPAKPNELKRRKSFLQKEKLAEANNQFFYNEYNCE